MVMMRTKKGKKNKKILASVKICHPMNNQPDINEIVGLLNEYNREAIQQLKDKHPQFQALLKPGITMGREAAAGQEELAFRAEVATEGLMFVVRECEERMPKLRKRLSVLKHVQFISQLIIAFSGASIIAMIGKEAEWVNLAGASLALAGSLLTIFVQHRSNGMLSGSESLSGVYDKLVGYRIKAENALKELGIWFRFRQPGEQTDELMALITQANGLCEDIRILLEKME